MGAQILALRHTYGKYGVPNAIANQGLLVFATPFGLRPHAPRLEQLDGPVHSVERALAAFTRHGSKIDRLRAADGAPMHVLVSDLEPHFQEDCASNCVLAGWCRQRQTGRAAEIGDRAVQLLGPEVDIARLANLIAGARPRDDKEAKTAAELRRIAELLGLVSRAA